MLRIQVATQLDKGLLELEAKSSIISDNRTLLSIFLLFFEGEKQNSATPSIAILFSLREIEQYQKICGKKP